MRVGAVPLHRGRHGNLQSLGRALLGRGPVEGHKGSSGITLWDRSWTRVWPIGSADLENGSQCRHRHRRPRGLVSLHQLNSVVSSSKLIRAQENHQHQEALWFLYGCKTTLCTAKRRLTQSLCKCTVSKWLAGHWHGTQVEQTVVLKRQWEVQSIERSGNILLVTGGQSPHTIIDKGFNRNTLIAPSTYVQKGEDVRAGECSNGTPNGWLHRLLGPYIKDIVYLVNPT